MRVVQSLVLRSAACIVALLMAATAGCAPSHTGVAYVPFGGVTLRTVATGLDQPVHLAAAPGDTTRLIVVEQNGRIRVITNGRLRAEPFLDISDSVSTGGERGLLSVAFHPRYAENGFFYVDFTDVKGDTHITRFHRGVDHDHADASSGTLLLAIAQPYANHNGGLVAFGPDRMLYVGMGDGGSGGDPHGNGQNSHTLLGKILRLDVDRGVPYAIPTGNPYANGKSGRAEIWALGVRNPWRYAFDPPSGLLYVSDVGQDKWEEIDAVDAAHAGLNYGWSLSEGSHSFHAGAHGRLVQPIEEYGHDIGCSITGGAVYRGHDVPALVGHFIYGDYCGGWIRSFRYDGTTLHDRRAWQGVVVPGLTSFGTDARGEMYVVSHTGTLSRIVAAGR